MATATERRTYVLDTSVLLADPTAVTRFEAAMLTDMRANHADILKDIRDKRDLSDETKGKLKGALDAFAKSFA